MRAVRLRAEGADFSLGADLRDPALAAAITGGEASRRALAELGQQVVDALASLPVPTVVAARGRILGAGACFFTVCDFRLAAPGATLGFPEVDRAMHLSWGILPRMVRTYGESTATRLALLGDPIAVDRLGETVERVDDPDAASEALARRLADKPALALREILAVLRTGDASRDAERFAATAGSADFVEAMTAFLTKRSADFRKRGASG